MRRLSLIASTALAAALIPATGSAADPVLMLGGGDIVSLSEPQPITIGGLEPGQTVTLEITRRADYQPEILLVSSTAYTADETGTVSTAEDAPVDALWETPDAYGPFWSMRRSDTPADGYAPGEVRVSVDTDGDDAPDLSTSFTLLTGEGRMVETPLGEDFPGAFLIRPEGSEGETLPLIVVLGGSEGGDSTARSLGPQLAIEGYAVLGLPYYSPSYASPNLRIEGLPTGFANLPVEYVAEAVMAIEDETIDTSRTGLYGVSKGAEFALLSGSYAEDEYQSSLCAVAAIVPSDVVWEGWGTGHTTGETPGFSLNGEPMDFVPYVGMDEAIAALGRGERVTLTKAHEDGFNAYPDRVAAARIPVKNIAVPVLVAGSDDDTTWASGRMTRNIVATRDKASLPTLSFVYADAGHGLSGSAYRPASTQAAAAHKELWPATIAFFNDTLKQGDCALD